jgi:hypothetical protein
MTDPVPPGNGNAMIAEYRQPGKGKGAVLAAPGLGGCKGEKKLGLASFRAREKRARLGELGVGWV